jgi:hypothetical protein
VFSSTKPAVLVSFDGDPIWSQIQSTDLKYAVNTNWDVFQYAATGAYYLRNDESWLEAAAITGRGRRPAPCRQASRSSRPTTTGRKSRNTCLAARWRRLPSRRSS